MESQKRFYKEDTDGMKKVLIAICFAWTVFSAFEPASGAPAKNVILMISDGCGYNHIEATDDYNGHAQPYEAWTHYAVSTWPGSTSSTPLPPGSTIKGGYDPHQAWTNFDYVKQGYTDSAAAATTLATGQKTYNNAIGKDLYGNDLINIAEIAKTLGKSAGVVTSVPWSHATPAG